MPSNKKQVQIFQDSITLIVSKIQSFSNNEILQLIPFDVLNEIKSKDEHPFFQAYSICHEGISMPKLIGETSEPITWTRRAVQSIKNLITRGVKFFLGHNEDNTTEGRRVLGEVVADTQKEINGKLHHIVIAYHSPEVREEVKNYDICSQEAVWNFVKQAGKMIAYTIDKLTGIALQSSTIEKPAFAGAKRLGMVQAFENIQDVDDVQGEPQTRKETKKMPTFQEITQAIKDMNIFPSQLYTIDDLQKDRGFSSYFSEKENTEKALADSKKKLEEMEKNHSELIRKTQLVSAKTRLENITNSEELKLTDKQKKFVNKKFSEDIEDLSDEGLKNFVNKQVEEYQEYASLFDVKEVDPIKNNTTPNTNTEDYTKAENNELLTEDFEL